MTTYLFKTRNISVSAGPVAIGDGIGKFPRLASKDPNDTVDYAIDWSDWLSGDTIAKSRFTVPVGITRADQSFSSTATVVWLQGGESGEVYTILNRIETVGGRKRDQSFTVEVKEK